MWVTADLLTQPLFETSIHFVIWSTRSRRTCYTYRPWQICTDDAIYVTGTTADPRGHYELACEEEKRPKLIGFMFTVRFMRRLRLKLKTGAFPFCFCIRHHIFLLPFLLYQVSECNKHLC